MANSFSKLKKKSDFGDVSAQSIANAHFRVVEYVRKHPDLFKVPELAVNQRLRNDYFAAHGFETGPGSESIVVRTDPKQFSEMVRDARSVSGNMRRAQSLLDGAWCGMEFQTTLHVLRAIKSNIARKPINDDYTRELLAKVSQTFTDLQKLVKHNLMSTRAGVLSGVQLGFLPFGPRTLLGEITDNLCSGSEFSPSTLHHWYAFARDTSLIGQVGSGWGALTVFVLECSQYDLSEILLSAVSNYFCVDVLNTREALEVITEVVIANKKDSSWLAQREQAARDLVEQAQKDVTRMANEIDLYANTTWS